MTIRTVTLCAGAILAAIALQATAANALTMAECSAKYKAAKSAGTLNGMKWNEFRKVQCGAQATAAPASTAAPARVPTATGYAVFPRAVDPKYSRESPGKARMETCLDQYRANKASNANAGLKWIEKGGGYYSECTKRLKGAA
jgi:Ni/Co efflux regulator RcnB